MKDKMAHTKPDIIANDPYMSAKWDQITDGHDPDPEHIPTLTLLVNWYAILDRCMRDLTRSGDTTVAYTNDQGDIRAMPQLATMKQASAEIRALTKQLHLDAHGDAAAHDTGGETPLDRARRARQLKLKVRNGGKTQRKAAA